jgi:predicted ArsR family transcriptional regulator
MTVRALYPPLPGNQIDRTYILLADGAERTAAEVAEWFGIQRQSARRSLSALADDGSVARRRRSSLVGAPFIYRRTDLSKRAEPGAAARVEVVQRRILP